MENSNKPQWQIDQIQRDQDGQFNKYIKELHPLIKSIFKHEKNKKIYHKIELSKNSNGDSEIVSTIVFLDRSENLIERQEHKHAKRDPFIKPPEIKFK